MYCEGVECVVFIGGVAVSFVKAVLDTSRTATVNVMLVDHLLPA